MLEITPLNHLASYLQRLTRGRLWLQVIIALILGAGLGMLLNPTTGLVPETFSETAANWFNLPGKIFLKLVKMIMIPLIITSIISGIVSNSSDSLKTMGFRLLLYFLLTTIIAIVIGAVVTFLFKPGAFIHDIGGFPTTGGESPAPQEELTIIEDIPGAISNLIPDNPLQAMLMGEMLGVVIFTIIIGVAVIQLKPDIARPIIRFAEAIQKICMVIVSWAMVLVPFAVFGLMTALLSTIGLEVLAGLAYYLGVVLLGLLILLICYLILLVIFTGSNPLKFLRAIRAPQLLAFSTASSAAVMPLSMKVADEKLGVSSNISDFVIPVGATINMDGTALFQCISVLFLAQAYGIDLSFLNLVIITVTVVAASIGTPAIPGGGVIILASVLQSTGIPTDGLVVIIGIDRILGMFRTSVNVTGDLTACVIFNKWFGA